MASSHKAHFEGDPEAVQYYARDGVMTTVMRPKALNFTWGNDTRYWRLPTESWGNKEKDCAAELVQVCWLEVTAGPVKVEPGIKYGIGMNVSMRENAFGWSESQVYLMAKIGKKGKYIWTKIKDLENVSIKEPFTIPAERFEIFVPNDHSDPNLYFGLYDVWSRKWKGGLQIHSAFVEEIENSVLAFKTLNLEVLN